MSRMKSVVAVLVLTAVAGLVPYAHATAAVKVVAAGSSGMWQTMALGAWNNGSCPTGGTAPCEHYTDSVKFNLIDTRPTLNGLGGTAVTDTGDIWIVWDHANKTTGTHNVWAYIKVDSVVGDRCFLAQPQCTVQAPSPFPAAGNKITFVWGADSTPPSDVQSLFSTGTAVVAAATDIRPEDAYFAICRNNSKAGKAAFDSTDGLGYNPNNAAGTCATYPAGLAGGVGDSIGSGVGNPSTDNAHVLAFSLPGGEDPLTGTTVPAATTYSVGADAIIFAYSAGSQLSGLSNATETQLQNVFGGIRCDADAFGLSSGGIQVYQREPLSGTMNTTEATVFRLPVAQNPNPTVYGTSQENGVNGTNPLTGTSVPCSSSDGKGGRWRAIGTSEEVASVQNSDVSGKNTWGPLTGGIGYAFQSFGTFSALAGNAAYGYVTLDGVEPILSAHPSNNELPVCSYPCSEASIWGTTGTSYPNIRNGTYTAWSIVRFVVGTKYKGNVTNMVKASQKFVVDDVPDYIPAISTVGTTGTDPGLKILRSHYQQWNGTGADIGTAPHDAATEGGGDMGGCVETIKSGKGADETKINMINSAFGEHDTACVVRN
jgi:hypothetical protein